MRIGPRVVTTVAFLFSASSALADMPIPPSGHHDFLADFLAATLSTACAAALGLWGLWRMARRSAELEHASEGVEPGQGPEPDEESP